MSKSVILNTDKNIFRHTQDDSELKPLKVVIHGPPASGKTKLAQRLCQRYGAHYVSVLTMIEETLEELRNNIEKEKEHIRIKTKGVKTEDDSEETEHEIDEEEEDEENGEDIEVYQEQIRDITTVMAKSENGRLPDEYVVRLMKNFLAKDVCQTRGYVLDGYPKTMQQTRELFGQTSEGMKQLREGGMARETPGGALGEGGEGQVGRDQLGGMIGNASIKIMPDYIVSLLASDDFLCERVMKLPQRNIVGTHYDEVNMLRRLAEFRKNNDDENNILTFFDEAHIHPILVNLVDEQTGEPRDFFCIFDYLTDIFGKPIPGFGLTEEEEEEIRKLELEQQRLQNEGDRIEKQLLEEKATREYQDKMERWAETFQKLQMEEEKILVAQSEPLRFYLMKYVFPTLSKALIEVARVKPDDPVDYLAEYLFRENPEGKMFDPSYTRDGEQILGYINKNVEPNFDD